MLFLMRYLLMVIMFALWSPLSLCAQNLKKTKRNIVKLIQENNAYVKSPQAIKYQIAFRGCKAKLTETYGGNTTVLTNLDLKKLNTGKDTYGGKDKDKEGMHVWLSFDPERLEIEVKEEGKDPHYRTSYRIGIYMHDEKEAKHLAHAFVHMAKLCK